MSLTHGLSKTRAYNSWHNMMYRCTSPKAPNYEYYGGRGITVCERWLDFRNFYADMDERPEGLTLDRIDNDRGYEPGNCRWTTHAEQQRNSRNRKLTQADIDWIRSSPSLSRRQMAHALGVSAPTVTLIANGRKWAVA